MTKNLLRGVKDSVKAPFAGADPGDVERIIDGLDDATRWDLARAVNFGFDSGLSDEAWAEDMDCRVEVATKLRSFIWPETGA